MCCLSSVVVVVVVFLPSTDIHSSIPTGRFPSPPPCAGLDSVQRCPPVPTGFGWNFLRGVPQRSRTRPGPSDPPRHHLFDTSPDLQQCCGLFPSSTSNAAGP